MSQKRRRGSTLLLVFGGLVLAGIVGVAAVLAFGDGGSSGSVRRGSLRQPTVVNTEMQVTVEIVDKDYKPRNLVINKGATVTWQFKGKLPHNATDDRGAWASPSQTTGEWSRTFDTPGTFYYFCTIHHGMLGTLTVRE